ncbi:insulinase family protein [Faecalicatena contorta]|uniref:insulinase family protein n=1 Tax=Faecalicatena contorta TaxID=39482 RepID=UPI0019618710|nr:insulinase family protein [Faecalicatena contorta]MBM6685756.1 insulinase family protein [Faecalicatena contorta]MBM6710370.1 insulinase family protein [Faecalicatena contorta]
MYQKRQGTEQAAAVHGFIIDERRELPQTGAVLWQMHFEKNGARILWLERGEENKTFAAVFKTLPSDDTGVFHILEHSLLCGSRKYPVSKPFVEMIKSSMQTFMNAFTFPDKTMYPVSSRNQQDFLNLMDVYLDAVLHPLCVEKKEIFLQEGWHYELDSPEGELACNGVVYNEMKGMYASPDTLIDSALTRALFPDNCYRFQSGGDPACIPQLTYEEYREQYREYYHPSDAWFLLDGEIDIEPVLEKIGQALSGFGPKKEDHPIPLQKPVQAGETRLSYETGEEDIARKTILAQGWVYGRFDEPEKNLACQALGEMLCGSDEAPLKKALLERGLAESVEFSRVDGVQQPWAVLVVRNADGDREQEIWDTVQAVLEKLAAEGLDRKRLEAVISRMEFRHREKETGGFPQGVVNCMKMAESCLYGGDPAQNLCLADVFCRLREETEGGYFERFIRENLLENRHTARLVLSPSRELGERKRREEADRLREIKARWSGQEKEKVIGELAALRRFQSTPDRPEALAALPVLSLADIPEEMPDIPQRVTEEAGVTVLCHPLETEGIVHLVWYFSAEDMEQEELHLLSFLQTLLGQTGTEHFDALELTAALGGELGRFQTGVDVFAPRGETEICRPCFAVHVSALEEKLEAAKDLTREVLLDTDFSDLAYLRGRLRQLLMSLEQHVLMYGDSYASLRIAAGCSAKGAAREALRGIGMLDWLRETDRRFEERGEELAGRLKEMCRRLFVRRRAVLSVTGQPADKDIAGLATSLPVGEGPGRPALWTRSGKVSEGILIPAQVGFAGKGGHLARCGAGYSGSMAVAARILSYGYLWDTVRVKGGAYGTRLTVSPGGDVAFTSFRDPSAAASLAAFDRAGGALRELCGQEKDLTSYIVSAIASSEPLLTARQKGIQAAEDYMEEVTGEARREDRRQILHTTAEDLEKVSYILDEICEKGGSCIVGSQEALDAAGDALSCRRSL